MARTADCPTCAMSLTVHDEAARGSFVRCPSCEEIFQPVFLKPLDVEEDDRLPYDPHTAARYDVRKPRRGERTAEDDAKAVVRGEIRRERQRPKPPRASRGVFSGIEGFFLVSSIVLAAGIPIAWFGMRWLTEKNPIAAGYVVVGTCLVVGYIGASARYVVRQRRWRNIHGYPRDYFDK